ncbi:hypothetical protein, partial [Rhizobium johnstonii]|uniref:hypothetical protein n=1 Tax=Rhizobium johnstonii TaxID=3019933 RepID=UPI003F97ECE3
MSHSPARRLIASAALCATLAGFSFSISAGFDLPRKRTDLSEADLKRFVLFGLGKIRCRPGDVGEAF